MRIVINMCKLRKKALINWFLKDGPIEPIRGFEHKRNADGSLLNYYQQLNASYQQLVFIVEDLRKRGKSECQILQTLSQFR